MAETTIEWTHGIRPDGSIIPGYTFNPWLGCTKVAEGCKFCYAERDMDKRYHKVEWGPSGTRVVTIDSYWMKPIKWNREAEAAGERRKVFCASLADVFEDWQLAMVDSKRNMLYTRDGNKFEAPIVPSISMRQVTMDDCRRRLFRLVDSTPWLDWLVLTKRPENVPSMWTIPACKFCDSSPCLHLDACDNYSAAKYYHNNPRIRRNNVWLITSASTQSEATAYGVALLDNCRSLSPVLGLSIEPLIGPIPDLPLCHRRCNGVQPTASTKELVQSLGYQEGQRSFTGDCCGKGEYIGWNIMGKGFYKPAVYCQICGYGMDGPQMNWVIVGGESGPDARIYRPEWVRSIIQQCADAQVPLYHKQLGQNIVIPNDTCSEWPNDGDGLIFDADAPSHHQGDDLRVWMKARSGTDPNEWAEDLRVREFPTVRIPQVA